MNDQTALVPVTPAPMERMGAFSSEEAFESAQRMAKLLCASTIVPESYRKNVADCVIALEMANRIGANPLAVMQNLYIVHGRPAWSSQFLISCVNASGKFSPMRYIMSGTGDDYGCIAWANDKSGERLEGPKVTIGMAKKEGWFGRNGSKWQTMPDLMLRYRAATLFARLFAPELTMGIQADDEIIDIGPVVTDPVALAKPVQPLNELRKPKAVAEVSEIRPAKPEAAPATPPATPPKLTVMPPPEPAPDTAQEPADEIPFEAAAVPVAPAPATPPATPPKLTVMPPAEPPPPSDAPMTKAQQAAEVAVMSALGEVEGSDDKSAWEWCAIKWPSLNWKAVQAFNQVPDAVCVQITRRKAELVKYLTALAEARKGGGK